jgi:hypothetical protein
MKAIEIICARGHENIQSTNAATFEITRETFLTKHGDCIIAVGANAGAADLSRKFVKIARNDNAKITIKIAVDEEIEIINARGDSRLSFNHPTDLVVRKSNYVCGRTLAVYADKAARDLSKKMLEKLHSPTQTVRIELMAENPP